MSDPTPTTTDVEYAVVDPRTGVRHATYPLTSAEELTEALADAHRAASTWRDTPLARRTRVLSRIAALHLERRDELSRAISLEMGKSEADAVGEVEFAAAIYQYYADEAERHLADELVEVTSGAGTAIIRRSPVGVLLGIMPWNFPAYQVARFAAPNLAVGNTILLKHAPQCPMSAELLEKIVADAGAEHGTYVNVRLSNDQVADVIADPRVQGVSLTGSERAGSAVAEIAGRHLKKVVLELGGSDPFLVLGAQDLGSVVDAAVAARMENTGQACNAGKRFIVVDELYDPFVEAFAAALAELGPSCPPLSSVRAAHALEAQLDNAVRAGASLTGGERDGARVLPGVLTGVSRDNPVFEQELFGPIAMVFRVRDEAEAVDLANDTAYGLGSYVYTDDEAQAERVADQIQAGMVFINCVGAEGAELPFGGTKRSGFGRELGRPGLDEFVNKKLIRSGA